MDSEVAVQKTDHGETVVWLGIVDGEIRTTVVAPGYKIIIRENGGEPEIHGYEPD